MSFHPLAKILVTMIPGSSTLLQIVSEFEAAAVQKRLENLEDPLACFGPEIDSLCSRLYEDVRGIDECTNLVPWNEVYAPHLKLLNRLEANGLIYGAAALFNRNAFERGIRLRPRFVVHLASYYGDAHLCAEMAEGMDQLETGITGDKIREQLPLPPMVIDAFFSIYEEEGQGMKSKTIGYSYYTPR